MKYTVQHCTCSEDCLHWQVHAGKTKLHGFSQKQARAVAELLRAMDEQEAAEGEPEVQWWTIAFDGEIGYFGTTRNKAYAEKKAAEWQERFPQYLYEVVPEEDDESKRETLW